MVRIAIIGAGVSGITATKACVEEGFDVIVYEKTHFTGGLWHYDDDDDNSGNMTKVAKSTVTTGSKEFQAFSDFPPPDDFPNIMHNTKVIEYLEMYGQTFEFNKYVQFNHEIVKCEPSDDYEETGRWTLTIRDISNDKEFMETFDGVAVCSGGFSAPNIPEFPDQHLFKGKIIHMNKYKNSTDYAGKTVVIVGVGNSGCDAADDISTVAKNVYLSTRSGAWILKRVGISGLPNDLMLTRFGNAISKIIPYNLQNSMAEHFVNLSFDHSLYKLRPKTWRIMEKPPIFNDALPYRILTGAVKVKGNIEKFTENGVIFEGENGNETQCDVIIMASGYVLDLPFLSKEFVSSDVIPNLYKLSFSPNLLHPKTLCMIGIKMMNGIIPFFAFEMQSRIFALLMANKIQLPSKPLMLKDIKKYIKIHESKRPANPIQYLNECAAMIGVKPNLWKYFFTDNKLWRSLIFKTFVSYQYRLNGPHSWSDARNAILTLKDRVEEPLKGKLNKKKNSIESTDLSKPIIG